MTDSNNNSGNNSGDNAGAKRTLTLSGKGKLELKKPVGEGLVKQSFSHGRSKTVAVEVKRKRDGTIAAPAAATPAPTAPAAPATTTVKPDASRQQGRMTGMVMRQLTDEEREARARALRGSLTEPKDDSNDIAPMAGPQLAHAPIKREDKTRAATADELRSLTPDQLRARELEELRQIQDLEKQQAQEAEKRRQESQARQGTTEPRRGGENIARRAGEAVAAKAALLQGRNAPVNFGGPTVEEEENRNAARRKRGASVGERTKADTNSWLKTGRVDLRTALDADDAPTRARSMASLRRAHERERRRSQAQQAQPKISRDVVVPEFITVGELANRMAERGADVIKVLMKNGIMATITQSIDADTAELIATELGHRVKRVADTDVETAIQTAADADENLQPRPPVVTVMGHVDHGKTSLLDALRKTNVVSREAGGITQHIGAYQVNLASGQKVTFIDTPGHAAFTEMRARGANITDIIILVVAADDGIMPQTIEAIKHAKAAKVPMVVAINKCDKPGAKPDRVRQDLLQHEVQVEALGGDVLDVEISAKTGQNIDKLLEAILLQAEILNLRANPERAAEGRVLEARLERGRGAVASVLVQRGTIAVGDIFVAGSEWGRVRALLDDRGANQAKAGPASPVEILGLNGVPVAGDDFIVVDSDVKAREVSEFRARKRRMAQQTAAGRGTLEQMLTELKAGTAKELPVVIKGDVHGSVEAIRGALEKVHGSSAEVRVRVLDASVGAISESDITLANASKAFVIGFNVRANPQARDMAKRDGIEIRYYDVIYNIIDEVKAALSGLLSPETKEKIIGYAQIQQMFDLTKYGKVAGCKVTEGLVKRGAGVRLLRDNVVIHTGTLKTLRRFKDEVKEVKEGFECGMAFENYENIAVNDLIECFEVETVQRSL